MRLTQGSIRKALRKDRKLGPSNILVVWASNCDFGESAANVYAAKRKVPRNNLMELPIAWTPTDGQVLLEADARLSNQMLMGKLTANPALHSILIVGHFPTMANTDGWWGWPNNMARDCLTIGELFSYPYFCRDNWEDLFGFELNDSIGVHMPNRYPQTDVEEFGYKSTAYTQIEAWGENPAIKRYADGPFDFGEPFPILPYESVSSRVQKSYSTDGEETLIRALVPPNGRVNFAEYRNNVVESDLYFPCFHLDVSPAATGEDSELTYITRIIDDSIAAEDAKYSSFGNVYIDGNDDSDSHDTDSYGRDVHLDLLRTGLLDTETCFWDHLDSDAEEILQSIGDPDAPLNDNLPSGCSRLVPTRNGTWADQEDVFFRWLWKDVYMYSSRTLDTVANFAYRTGAIVLNGRSLGALPNPVMTCSPDYGAYTLLEEGEVNSNSGSLTQGNIAITTPLDFRGGIASVGYTGAATTATVEYVGGNLLLREDDVTVATIPVSSGTPREIVEEIYAATNVTAGGIADWSTNYNGGFWNPSDIALKNGAAVAWGALKEPWDENQSNPLGWVYALFASRDCLAELAFKSGPSGFSGAANGTSSVIWKAGGLVYYGDPLYRPFGHLE